MSEDTIQELGGTDLARHYPDRGPIGEAQWHQAVLSVGMVTDNWLAWLGWMARGTNSFLAVLSANADGLRIVVSLDDFAVFIPWAEATVSAERTCPATEVRLTTSARPSMLLKFHVDDEAADDLLRGVIPPLPQRGPPRRLAWWLANSRTALATLVTGITAGVLWYLWRSQ